MIDNASVVDLDGGENENEKELNEDDLDGICDDLREEFLSD